MFKKNLEPIVFLLGSFLIILLSIILKFSDSNIVKIPILNVALGNLYSCPIYNVFNIPCPTCGLTRAFILFAQFKFSEAYRYNVSVLLLYPYIVLQIPLQIIDIYKNYKSKNNSKLRRINLYLLITIGISLIIVWLLKLFHILPIL